MEKERLLKNGSILTIKIPDEEDAANLIHIIKTADTESRFLAREPGEFALSEEQEKELIKINSANKDRLWLVGYIDGKPVGMCSVLLVRSNLRYRHRAECALSVLKEYWGMGIGRKFMDEIEAWCKDMNIEQLELDVVSENLRARRMYENFGFTPWGTLKNGLKYVDGTYADLIYMVKRF